MIATDKHYAFGRRPLPPDIQNVSVEYPRGLSSSKYIFVRKSVFLGYVLKLLISTAGGRFHFITAQGRHLFKETTFTVSTLPRAWLEPPCASHSGVSRLMGLHYRLSHRRPFAIPAGQGRLRQRYIARRKLICIFEESPPSVPINDAVLRIMNKLKRLWK